MSLMRIPAAVALCVATALGLTVGATTGAAAAGSDTRLTHAQAVRQLDAAGITWDASGNCTERTRSVCTSFSGVRQSTIDGLRTLRSSSRCPLVVTGGTETGHASGTYSHWNGYKVDVAITSCVSGYIKRNFSYIGGNKWRSGAGNVYFNEGNHWDITYY